MAKPGIKYHVDVNKLSLEESEDAPKCFPMFHIDAVLAGYGLGFGFGVLLTGWISAYFNPALALAAWINGNGITSASEYFAIAFSTICGA
jgi:glycerol uptake facilitator-like aquaporin